MTNIIQENVLLCASDEAIQAAKKLVSYEDLLIMLGAVQDKRIVTRWFSNMSDECRKRVVFDMDNYVMTMYEGKVKDCVDRICTILRRVAAKTGKVRTNVKKLQKTPISENKSR